MSLPKEHALVFKYDEINSLFGGALDKIFKNSEYFVQPDPTKWLQYSDDNGSIIYYCTDNMIYIIDIKGIERAIF
jgi:hypothetical protein